MGDMAASVIGVRFREASKMYHFAPPENPIHVGDYVVVDTAHGREMGRVVTVPDEGDGEAPPDARSIVRMADMADRDQAIDMREKGEAMLRRMRALVVEAELDMYVVAFQVNLAGNEAMCHFQSDSHADFRSALSTVESEFEVRIHMQQAGPRDRAKLVDGYDICGLRLCCATWMTKFPKVGIRMAKEQQLALNPDKISGVCGRLLCCLTFEYPVYREMRGTLPKIGKRVSTPAGMGQVLQINVLGQTVMLALDDVPGRIEVPAAEIGMAVRVEESPNRALVDSGAVAEAVEAVAPSAPRESEPSDSADRSSGEERPRRRRRRRRRSGPDRAEGEARSSDGGSRERPPGEAQSRETGADGARQTGSSSESVARSESGGETAEGAPRRRRRRRRRRGGGGGGSEGDGGAPSGEGASGPD
jgi:cell fate regulator YaaT (PSP1 superfamily)